MLIITAQTFKYCGGYSPSGSYAYVIDILYENFVMDIDDTAMQLRIAILLKYGQCETVIKLLQVVN